jgi:acetyltransferase-like isoleucine patch superfamily enzyme
MEDLHPAQLTFREHLLNGIKIAYGSTRVRRYRPHAFGKKPVILGKVLFRFHGTVHIGDNFMVEGMTAGVTIKVARGAVLSIGDGCYMNTGSSIEVHNEVRIGDHALIAPFASIVDDDRHEVEPGSKPTKGPVTVGDNVWLGRNVAVLPGVTIGDGSVIGANSVVSRDIPPGCFAAGVPARVIRKLDLPEGWVRW